MSKESPASYPINAINQVGIVVKDIDAAVERYWKDFGIGPWGILTFGPTVGIMTYHGKPCSYSIKVAMAQVGPIQLELIQPLDGPTPHKDFLEQKGEGLQHLGIFVPNLEEADKVMRRLGHTDISGAYGFGSEGGNAAYYDTDKTIGVVLELIESPEKPGQPERFYPDNA